MVWPFSRPRQRIARLEITGAIAAATRRRVLKALKTVEAAKFPALLLRIDSPGGTVGDSQEIFAALERLQPKTKIVASFGNISASGGVYIGMGAEKIVANPGTITGSIGVILQQNNLGPLLDRIGVSFKAVKSGPYKDILAFDRAMTPAEESLLQQLIDVSYEQFVATVAGARNLTVETVREFADGRIFTGQQALELGIVDRLGPEEEARRWAAELAGLDPDKVRTVEVGERPTGWRRFLPGGGTRSQSRLASAWDWVEFELATSGQPLWLYRS